MTKYDAQVLSLESTRVFAIDYKDDTLMELDIERVMPGEVGKYLRKRLGRINLEGYRVLPCPVSDFTDYVKYDFRKYGEGVLVEDLSRSRQGIPARFMYLRYMDYGISSAASEQPWGGYYFDQASGIMSLLVMLGSTRHVTELYVDVTGRSMGVGKVYDKRLSRYMGYARLEEVLFGY